MDHTRHSNLFVVPPFYNVALIGAGGIGSPTAISLVKMGVNFLEIWDDDRVSPENIATQVYKTSDVGKTKVMAIHDALKSYSDDVNIYLHAWRIAPGITWGRDFDLVISAVDTIQARKDIWEVIQDSRPRWYLDARMSAEQYQHYLVDCYDQEMRERYSAQLSQISDDDVPDVPCTEKATIYTGFMAAGHICATLKDILTYEAFSHRLVHYIWKQEILKLEV